MRSGAVPEVKKSVKPADRLAAPPLLWESLGLSEYLGLVRLGSFAAVDQLTDVVALGDPGAPEDALA